MLAYNVAHKREATSWRAWGGIQTEEDALREVQRIRQELEGLASSASFPLTILPLSSLKSEEEALRIREETASADVVLVYAAGGGRSVLEALVSFSRWSILFVRHRSGPLYLWYEIVHPHFLRKRSDEFREPRVGVDDVVVDDYAKISWRLRILYALKNTLGSRIISIGNPSGWGIGKRAVELALERWGLDIKSVTYPELTERIREARSDSSVLRQARLQAEEYVSQEGISLHTERRFVDNCRGRLYEHTANRRLDRGWSHVGH